MLLDIVLTFCWIVCGVLTYGLVLGDFVQFSQISHAPRKLAWCTALLGPFGVLVALVCLEPPYKLRWKGW